MKISEIELVGVQPFPKKTVEHYLTLSSPRGKMDEFFVFYAESDDTRVVILVDDKQIAAGAGFITRLNGRVWQARWAQTFPPFKGQQLIGRIYKMIKESFKQSVQSDTVQSMDGAKIWTKTLPSLGMNPMIYDSETHHIIDPKTHKVDIFPQKPTEDDPTMHRYSWILEKNDWYRDANILKEGSLTIPYSGLWYDTLTGEKA